MIGETKTKGKEEVWFDKFGMTANIMPRGDCLFLFKSMFYVAVSLKFRYHVLDLPKVLFEG